MLALIPDPELRSHLSGMDTGMGMVVHLCSAPAEADRLLAHLQVDVVLAADPPGTAWLAAVHARDPDAFRILAIPAKGLERAVDAINRGDADAVLRLPWNAEHAVHLFHHGCEAALLRRHNRSLIDELAVRNTELLSFNERLEDLVSERTRHLVEAQARLKAQQRQLVQLETSATVTHLLRGLAHEFNNPLAAIFGYTQRLRRQLADNADVVRRLDVIMGEIDHCRAVVGQLRALATPLTEETVRIDPAGILEDAVERVRAAGTTPPPAEVAPGTPDPIAAPHALASVFEQILLNAADAGARTCRLSGAHASDRVRLVLENDGATPTDAELANAIRPFFTTRAGEGRRGLGLSTAAALLREQGGTIELVARPGGGAAAVIMLPAADPAPTAPEPAAMVKTPLPSDEPPRPYTLVVDDEPMVAEILVDTLREAGHQPALAGSVAEAVAELARREVGCLVVDLNLPDGNGLDLARRALTLCPRLSGHIALTTGEADQEVLQRLVADSGFPVLGKPFRIEEVLRLARQIG
jgi:signal transduction histidine kinase/CheY-like chemotaxis protein